MASSNTIERVAALRERIARSSDEASKGLAIFKAKDIVNNPYLKEFIHYLRDKSVNIVSADNLYPTTGLGSNRSSENEIG